MFSKASGFIDCAEAKWCFSRSACVLSFRVRLILVTNSKMVNFDMNFQVSQIH